MATLRWSAIVLAGWLAACTTSEDEARVAHWEAGNVFPANYRAEILAYLRTYLNDPANVRDAAVSEPVLRSVGTGNRYVVCMRYAQKREAGSQRGIRDHVAIFVAGKLDRFVELRAEQARGEAGRNEQCAGVTYAPFPEAEKLSR